MVSDAQVFEAQLAGASRHVLQTRLAVAPVGVTMKDALDIFHLDKLWQAVLGSRFHFSHLFAQLRRYIIHAESAVEIGFLLAFQNLAWPRELVFVELQP